MKISGYTELFTPSFASQADPKSRYRRLQRFFREVVFDYDAIARLIMAMFDLHDQSYYLTLDRTNWQCTQKGIKGEKNLNILTLGIVYKGTAIPVYWLVLNKRGNSSQRERIALLQRFIRQFGRSGIPDGSGMNREIHVPFCERLRGKFPQSTHHENNNTLKTKGYHFEHNFGHGQQFLSSLLATLILLAYLVHMLLDLMDDKFCLLRQTLPSRKRVFDDMKALTTYFCFDSWEHLLDFML